MKREIKIAVVTGLDEQGEPQYMAYGWSDDGVENVMEKAEQDANEILGIGRDTPLLRLTVTAEVEFPDVAKPPKVAHVKGKAKVAKEA